MPAEDSYIARISCWMGWLVIFWISIFQTRKDLASFSAPKVALRSFISVSGSPTGISSRFSSTPSSPSPFDHPKTKLLNTRRAVSTLSPFLKTPVQVYKPVFCLISILEDVPDWGFLPRSRASVSFMTLLWNGACPCTGQCSVALLLCVS